MTKNCFITVKDEVYCTVSGLSPSDLNYPCEKFAVFVDGYFFMPMFKFGKWDGKIRFFEKTGRTYIRLLDKILPFVENWGYEIHLTDNRVVVDSEFDELTPEHFASINPDITLRPYQVNAVNMAVKAGSGFVVAGTGSGKSLMTAALCDIFGKKDFRTITIVPSSDLVSQTSSWYVKLGLDVGEYCGGNKDIHHQHIVATWQSLQNNPQLMSLFQVVVIDECHGAKAAVVQKLLNDNGRNIPYRFGFTGTFPKPEADKMSLTASIGNILYEVPARWLIDNGYLAEVEIEIIRTKVALEDGDLPDYQSERAYLVKNESRMDYIADTIIEKCEQYGNTLVLVNSVEFGENLQHMIKDASFLYGMTDKDERKLHYDAFENENGVIKIATAGIASTGISIDRVFCLILVDAGKSFIRCIQSVGRGTRLSHDKKKVHVVDICGDLKWSRKHSNERIKFYKEALYPYHKPTVVKIKEK